MISMKRILILATGLTLAGTLEAAPLDLNATVTRRGKATTTTTQSAVQQPTATAHVQAKGQVNAHRNLSGAPVRNNLNSGLRSNAQLHARHFDLKRGHVQNQVKVSFRQNRAIAEAQRWQGQKYAAFRNYRAQWHDRQWWRNHCNRIVFVYGGWYYWDTGWWYPAWGYDPYAFYYYDGPIYAYNDLPPDQVIANVQTSLQDEGYYDGEIDGVLGPLTRAAIAAYQADHGLYVTSAIDEPTLDSLGML